MRRNVLRRLRRRLGGVGVALACTVTAAFGGEAGGAAESRSDWEAAAGPLIHTFPLTLEPGDGLEALGPFFYRHETEEGTLWAIPPLVSSFTSFDREKHQVFILPPVFSSRRWGQDRRWQLGQWLNRSRVESTDDRELKRFNVFPFLFYQNAPGTDRDYWAFFPLYGTLQNRMFRDEAEFVLFPVWLKTRKGSMTTRNIGFPFFHLRDGPGLDGWQLWPLAGHEHQDPTTRTNLSDEVEVVPGHDKTFGLWPVYFRNRLGLGTDNPARVDAVLPLYYVDRSPQRDHTAVMWPFVSWTDDRKEGFRQWNTPWPLVGFARGEGKTLDRVLPFFSVGRTRTLDTETYLWPIYKHRRVHTEAIERDRTQWVMFLYADLKERNVETGKSARRIDSWPLFSWTRNAEGQERLQALSVIEPLRRGLGLERNWSPLWALWRQERDPAKGASSESLLWNLYRRDATPESTKGSLLFGLVQYEKTSAGRRWRWFHLGPRPTARSSPAEGSNDVPKRR